MSVKQPKPHLENIESFYGHFLEKPPESGSYQLDDSTVDVNYGDCNRILRFIAENENSPLAIRINEALIIIRRVMRDVNKIALSFNGGKDATVVLHLVRCACVMQTQYQHDMTPHQFFKKHIVPFVIHTDPQFKEVAQFFVWADDQFNLNTKIYQGSTFKECLQSFVDESKLTHSFMGVRSTDPNGKNVIQTPSLGWPQITRVSPILSWTFVDVFDFLLRLKFKYCELYDKGFTSLGARGKTVRNPALGKQLEIDYRRLQTQQSPKLSIRNIIKSNNNKDSFTDDSEIPCVSQPEITRIETGQSLQVSRLSADQSPEHECCQDKNIELISRAEMGLVIDELKKRGVTDEMIEDHIDKDQESSAAFFMPLHDCEYDRRGRK
ncbi:FAD_synthetase [Hexamita inflata]|uniref:FAD synthase n=1 Tax=Hexamita inflata TaxID=28002 RepID=A0AA86R7W1_9EUKA|nr:FAD synthetase [Hexamita inflata]